MREIWANSYTGPVTTALMWHDGMPSMFMPSMRESPDGLGIFRERGYCERLDGIEID